MDQIPSPINVCHTCCPSGLVAPPTRAAIEIERAIRYKSNSMLV
jgi:hypothetical protein